MHFIYYKCLQRLRFFFLMNKFDLPNKLYAVYIKVENQLNFKYLNNFYIIVKL